MKIIMGQRLYSVMDIARRLNKREQVITYWIRTSKIIPEPRIQKGKRMFYTEKEFEEICNGQ